VDVVTVGFGTVQGAAVGGVPEGHGGVPAASQWSCSPWHLLQLHRSHKCSRTPEQTALLESWATWINAT
jgi:hypothetical protein